MDSPNTRLKFVRTEFGFTQTDFAEIVGLQQSYYCMLEKGKREIPSKVYINLKHKLGISMNWLVDGEGTMKMPETITKSQINLTNQIVTQKFNIEVEFEININKLEDFIKEWKQEIMDNSTSV